MSGRYPRLQLLHEADGVGQRLSLVASQRLQVQDGLCALGLQDPDGLQQPLVTDRRERNETPAVGLIQCDT